MGDLVKNPLLLTLLVIMQQNNILPSRRAELYEKVTESLLEGRNWDKKLPVVYEAPAIRRLSPIAHDMQERDRKLVMRSDVIASFIETIKGERRPLTSEENIQNEIQEDAVRFLTDICERVGIFVPRTPHFFGFFHPAFQEYFAAYHILKQIRDRRDLEIENLVQLVRQQSSRWRMPFLLTVAIASDKDEAISRQIINTLMMPIQDADLKSRTHDLLLAVECLIEAKPATIGDDIQRNVAEILLRTYMDAMSLHDNEARTQMCCMLGNWLRSISQGSSYSSLLATLRRVINNETWPERRVATFTLLSDVAEHLSACSPRVFSDLLPELFKVIGMPYVEENHKKVFNSTAAQKAAVKNAVIDAAQRDLLQAALLAAVHMSLVKNTNVHNVLCMSLQHLKIRFVSQVKFVLMLAEKTGDTHVFDLCKKLIQQVDLQIDDLRETLRKGEKSAKEEIVHLIQDIFNESKKN